MTKGDLDKKVELLERKLKREQLARIEAERLLEDKATEIYDIMEEHKLILRKLYKAQRLEIVGRLSSVIAHDFNNLIASMEGYANFLSEDLDSLGERNLKLYADNILKGVKQAHYLISRIKDYGSQQKVKQEDIDIGRGVAGIVELFESIRPKNVSLSYDMPNLEGLIEGNLGQLTDLGMNLLKNASDAIGDKENGKVEIGIYEMERYSLDEPRNYFFDENIEDSQVNTASSGRKIFLEPCIRIQVRDNGLGISEEVIRSIFKPYFSTKAKDNKGQGLGLFGVEGIVSSHGGGIKYSSALEVGTLVEIIFPVEKKKRHINVDDGFEDIKNILVVDDEELVGQMLIERIKRMGFNAGYASSAKEALEILKASHGAWDIIISDEMMPNMRGTQLLEVVKESYPNIPFIICSGFTDEFNKDEILALGASAFLEKPIDIKQLTKAIA